MLPEWNPKLSTGPLWDGTTPATQAEWVALGQKVFFTYPLRAEPLVEFAQKHPQLAADVGLEQTADGQYVGLVRFTDVDGTPRTGITCALCHAVVREGVAVAGPARRTFDYGKLRLAYHRETKEPIEADLKRRMETWGPGRADVTEDVDEDPVAIPDLWALKHQTALTQAGTIRHTRPTALVIRQETQLLHSNHEKVRPPRALAWALAMYLYSLEPARASVPPNPLTTRGAKLFARGCAECHSNAGYGGPPIAHEKIGTDAALAKGAARGTGNYRPPALVRVGQAGPYLHQGAVPTLEDLMSPERLTDDYRGSPLGPGAVEGHAFGTDWPKEDRDAVIAWMRTL